MPSVTLLQVIQKLAEYKTVDDVAKLLAVNSTTVLRWLNSGELLGFQLGKQWRIADSDIASFIDAQRWRQAHKIARRQAEKQARVELRRRLPYEPDAGLEIKLCDYCHDWPLVVSLPAWRREAVYCPSCLEDGRTYRHRPERLGPPPPRSHDAELDDLPF